MDPLVRAALLVQRALARTLGVAASVGFGAYLVSWAADPPPPLANTAVAGALAVALVASVTARIRRLDPEAAGRQDFVLFTLLVVAAHVGILHTPGRLDGPFQAAVYAIMMLVAAFSTPAVAIGTAVFTVLLEAALDGIAFGHRSLGELWPRALFVGLFALLNMAVFRAELARVRRLSRERIEHEIQRMRQAARSYRLLGTPSAVTEPRSLRAGSALQADDDRLVRSGVDEIHQAQQFALELLRRSLGLRTAALLWLDDSGQRLALEEISTLHEAVVPGPFRAKDGLLGAALTRGEPVALAGTKAARHLPYYAEPPASAAVIAAPLVDHGQPRGLLVADRSAADPFSKADEELLAAAAHFMLRAIENERVFVQLERSKIEQGKLYRAADLLAASITEAQVIEACVNSAREFASFDFAAVTLFDRTAGEHEICAVSGDGAAELVGQRFRHNSGLVAMVVANRHPLPYRGQYDAGHQVVFSRRLVPPAMPSLLVLPLAVHEKALGTLVLGSRRRHAFGDAVRPTLEVLASHVAVSLANARLVKRLEELATTDGLTGLFNKRALIEVGAQKLRSATRFNKPLSLLICDIDHFKKVNDTHGHDVGDVVIAGFGKLLRRTKRDTDAVGRFGGEEFVVVCEETDERGAMLLAERIRTEIAATTFHAESGPLAVTCSIGISTFPGAGREWETLFKATDEALYVSKRSGRNRTTAWSPSMRGCAA